MAAVLSSDDNSYFGSSMHRSHSHSSFPDKSSSYHQHSSTAASSIDHSYHPTAKPFSDSPPSSAPSSPRTGHAESVDLSYASTPASTFSFASDFDDTLAIHDSEEEEFGYPSFFPDKLFIQPGIHRDDNLEPPPSPRTGDSYSVSPADQDSSDNTSRPGTPECGEHAEDDTAVTTKPTRQVDYLSHDWREEDIWSSWRYIVARRGEFANSTRLENASWRTWMKSKNNLKTISPETLNWLKDCDVTWLYGPLQSRSTNLYTSHTEPSSSALSKTGSLINLKKKPILKKRSMSEVMLQRSLSSASLLKQATASVQAQETRGVLRPHLGRSNTDYATFPFSSRRVSQENCSLGPSTESSGITSPSVERKHIHFNEQVEQCIAVDVKCDDEDDVDASRFAEESDSSDGVMMKRMRSKKRAPPSKKRSKRAVSIDGKIIAKLPSTTLKYREDTPEPRETAMKHSTGTSRGSILSPSSSQETLRPTKPSSRFFFGEDEDDMDDEIMGTDSGWRSPPADGSGVGRPTSTSSLCDEPEGMRRTPSGMFMPYEEGDLAAGDGIFGRVIDTVNTARDIAHVIWNVGWRK